MIIRATKNWFVDKAFLTFKNMQLECVQPNYFHCKEILSKYQIIDKTRECFIEMLDNLKFLSSFSIGFLICVHKYIKIV